MTLVEQFNAYCSAAATFVASGDYASALNQAQAAQVLVAALPRVSRTAGTGGGAQAAEWNAEALDAMVKRIRQALGAGLGVQQSLVEMSEPGLIDDGSQFANSSGGYVQ